MHNGEGREGQRMQGAKGTLVRRLVTERKAKFYQELSYERL